MKGDKIHYREGFKYQLAKSYSVYTGITGYLCDTEYLSLSKDGCLIIRKGYAWDGPSGPTYDSKDSLRGSLVHDALYQLMRLGLLPESCREQSDKLLHDICAEDGMNGFRADLWQLMVEEFAGYAAKYGTERPILTAP
jgi:hypothetical protein